jgi:hypothetical protein
VEREVSVQIRFQPKQLQRDYLFGELCEQIALKDEIKLSKNAFLELENEPEGLEKLNFEEFL